MHVLFRSFHEKQALRFLGRVWTDSFNANAHKAIQCSNVQCTVNSIIFNCLIFEQFLPLWHLVFIKFSEWAKYCNVQTSHGQDGQYRPAMDILLLIGFPSCLLNYTAAALMDVAVYFANLETKLRIIVCIRAMSFSSFSHWLTAWCTCESHMPIPKKFTVYYFNV